MNTIPRSVERLVWGVLGLTIAAIVIAFIVSEARHRNRPKLPALFQVPDFTLTNQTGRPLGSGDLRGKVWIAEIIFTRCGGPCPRMTRRMGELQGAIPAEKPVRFVTLTTDPVFDTPAVLETYGRRFNAQPDRWHFLTGTKQQIADVAVRGLKLTAVDKEPGKMEDANDLFIHSTIFVIVDKHGQARAVVETEPPEGEPVPEVKAAVLPVIEQLLREK